MRKTTRRASVCIVLLSGSLARHALAQEKGIKWVPGPTRADLKGVATVDVEKGYVFADAAESRKVMELVGNRPSGLEAGLIMPAAEGQSWFISFDYNPAGYVADDEKNTINEKAILDGIKKGTEAANEYRQQKGFKPLQVLGWYQKPHYDEGTHNLVWALEAREEGGPKVVNYDVRVLGRRGFMSVTLVTDPESLSSQLPEVDRVLKTFSYKTGSRYAEFVKGDKLAGYGLTALVAGGAGAVAVKLGLFAWLGKFLAKAWKLVAVALASLVAGLKKMFRSFSKKGDVKTFDAP